MRLVIDDEDLATVLNVPLRRVRCWIDSERIEGRREHGALKRQADVASALAFARGSLGIQVSAAAIESRGQMVHW